MEDMEVKEFNIPVPWGHVAAVTHGEEINPLVLVVHGLWDNLGAFHQLIPLLPNGFYYVMIDLPGHGKSSQFPLFRPINTLDYVIAYKYVLNYLDRKSYTILAHSYGAHTFSIYIQLYPEQIEKMIVIDCVASYGISPDFFKRLMTSDIDKLNHLNNRICGGLKQPSYVYDECLKKLNDQRMYGGLSMETSKALLERWLIPAGDNKFKFALDPRTSCFICSVYDIDFMAETIKHFPIACPVLYIIGKDSIPVLEYFHLYMTELQKANKRCFVVKVDGDHDVHTNNASVIASVISNFLIHKFSKL